MKSLTKFGVLMFALAAFFMLNGVAHAAPIAEFTYIETDLGGGQWQYEYTLANTSDPVDDLGVDLYYISFDFSGSLTSTDIPSGWGSSQDTDFLELFSDNPGVPPAGTDIGPGMQLSGFLFQFDYQAGELPFKALFVNPDGFQSPFTYSGVSTPVPLPSTILLLCSGLAGLAGLSRKFRKA